MADPGIRRRRSTFGKRWIPDGKAYGLRKREGYRRSHNQLIVESEALGVDTKLQRMPEGPIPPIMPDREEGDAVFLKRALRARAPAILKMLDLHLEGEKVFNRDGEVVGTKLADPRVLQMALQHWAGKPKETVEHEIGAETRGLLEGLKGISLPVPVLKTGMVVEAEATVVEEDA
jgi:hypothetical protein